LDISFQLSFIAVLGIVYGSERFWPWWRRWEEARLLRVRGWRVQLWRAGALSVVVSVSALASTTPLTAFHFNQVSLVAPLANAVVVPLLGSVAVTLGLLAALLYPVSEALARPCVLVVGPFVRLGLWLVEVLAAWPAAAVRVVTPTRLELALAYGALFVLARLAGRRRAWVLALLALAAVGDGAWWYVDRYHRSELRVTFLSVGQGDGAVVELPGSEVMVIDGGGSSDSFDVGERVIAPFLWSRKIARVDYLVMSHPDRDHYGGLGFLAAHFTPREFWWNGVGDDAESFAALQQHVSESGAARRVVQRGDRRRLGVVEALVESPPRRLDGLSINDQSVVVSLAYGRTRVLFAGDIQTRAENDLVVSVDGQLASTVLKVPHHGSRTSSSPRFVAAVAPRLAVISAGFANRFHFPHPSVVERYAAEHVALLRTDLDGAVEVRLGADGGLRVRAQRAIAAPAVGRIGVDTPGPQG